MKDQSKQPLLPVYLLVGDDEQKKEVLEKRMKRRFLDLGDPALNTDVFSSDDLDVQAVLNACQTIPFACEKRLVVLRDVDALKNDEQAKIASYLLNPCETAVLFLTAKKLAKNTKLFKSIEAISKTCIVPCDSPKKYEFKKYINEVAKSKGIAFEQDASQRLLELVGDDTVAINTEIEKIANENLGNGKISVAEVEELVANNAEVKPWTVVDAFASKDLASVLTLLPQVKKSTPISILIMCVARARELMCAKECLAIASQNASEATKMIATELGFSPALSWRVKNHALWSKKWSVSELKNCVSSSLEAEKQMKSGDDQIAALNSWFLEVLS